MASQNEETVRRAYAALRANDLDAFLEIVDPEVEWHSLILEIEGTFHGHDGIREWWAGLRGVFPDWNPELVGVRESGDWLIARARGRGSAVMGGAGTDDDFWQVIRIKDGRIGWYRAVRTEREALAAAGWPT